MIIAAVTRDDAGRAEMNDLPEELCLAGGDAYQACVADAAVWMRRSPDAGAWKALLAWAEEPLLCGAGVVARAADAEWVRDAGALEAALVAAADRLEGGAAGGLDAAACARMAADLAGRARAAPTALGQRLLGVMGRRALDPLAGLSTYPPEALFDADEVAWLKSRPRPRARRAAPRPLWRSGQDVDYDGFACVIAKFTRLCNLRCVYCAEWRTGPEQTMPFQVQARLFETLLGSTRHGRVDVVWHGGEPTLVGRRAFLRVLYLQAWFRAPGQQVGNAVQTNAAGIDERWAAFLARYGFKAGVSLDGPEQLHAASRPDVRGRPTFAHTWRGIEHLRRRRVLGGVLVVITDRTLEWGAPALFDFLDRHDLRDAAFLAARPDLRLPPGAGMCVDTERYARFLVDFDRARRRVPERWIRVREIDTVLAALFDRAPHHCEVLGNCVGTFFAVEPDGTVRHCDKFGELPEYTLGNVLEHDFDTLRSGPRATALAHQADQRDEYLECPYFRCCRGWCPHERLVTRLYGGGRPGCCGLLPLFEGLQANLLEARAPAP